jgi:polysaccharide export outer membrane protein
MTVISGAFFDSTKLVNSAHSRIRLNADPSGRWSDIRVKQLVCGFCCGMALLWSGCAASPVSVPSPKEPKIPLPSTEYRIGPEDVLEIVVWKNAELSKTVTVRPDGVITLPLAGDIKASGLTATQLRDDIKNSLQRFLEVPEITVTVVDVRSYNVYILGEVQNPGKYQTKSHTTLLQVIAMAGGFTMFADSNEIVVVRQGRQGGQQRIVVRYKDLVRQGDIGLQPGDTIIVP